MLSRSANNAVKIGGMCWTTAIGTRMSCGPLMTVVSASGPPVETPMTTTSTLAVDGRRSRGAATIGGAATLVSWGPEAQRTADPGRKRRHLDLGDQVGLTAAMDADAADVGRLGHIVVGAALERIEVAWAPRSVNVENMITGVSG